MEAAYAGVDVAFAKKKRLPVVVCRFRGGSLEPLPLRMAAAKPPVGKGNARILDVVAVDRFADQAAAYLEAVESEFGVRIQRIAIDAPSEPKRPGAARRQCEIGLDRRQIGCITTPSREEFKAIRQKAASHLASGGAESRLPAANQLWMLVGFALFERLRRAWECLEVFPQAIACALGAHGVHKSRPEGLLAQLTAAARHTHWPAAPGLAGLAAIAYGSPHDRLDAYLAAWVASLDESRREAIGRPPHDAIWVPRLSPDA
jgi:Protein of unknown function (DUF429)